MFPKSKVIYSTLLPLADISLHTLSKINMKLIDRCSTLPNVHLVGHENIFSKGLDILHDKHLKKRHLGLFAANLVAAIRGWAKPPRSAPSQLHRSSPSSSRSLYTTPLENHAFPINSGHNRAYPTPEPQQQPPPLRTPYTSSLEGYSSYSNAVRNDQDRQNLPPFANAAATTKPTTLSPAEWSASNNASNRASRTQLFSFPSKRSVWR